MDEPPKTICIWDGNWVARKAQNSVNLGKNSVVFHFMRQLIGHYGEYDEIYVAWDGHGSTESRRKVDADYKTNRIPVDCAAEEDFFQQVDFIVELLQAMDIPSYISPGNEADDVINTLAKKHERMGDKVAIYTIDKDMLQCVNENTCVLHPKHGIMNRNKVKEIWGVYPEQFTTLQAIMGDTIDVVKGIQGIGKVTAAKIINGEKVSDRIQKLYDDNQELIEKNMKLVTLKEVEEFQIWRGKFDEPKVIKMLEEVGPSMVKKWNNLSNLASQYW